MANDLAKLVVRLEAESSKYQAGLERANRKLSEFERSAKSAVTRIDKGFSTLARRFVGIAAAAGSLNNVMGAITLGDDLAKGVVKSGMAAEAFTQLAHAAKMNDIELTAFSTSLKTMQVRLSEAGSGLKSAQEPLTALALNFKDLSQLAPDKQFELIADRISMLESPADKTRAAVELFGKAGADLLPMFEKGAAGIREARDEAIALNRSFSAIDLAKMQEADTAIKRMKTSFDSLSTSIAAAASGPLTSFLNSVRFAMGDATHHEKLMIDVRNMKLLIDNMSDDMKNSERGAKALNLYADALERLGNFRLDKVIADAKNLVPALRPPGFEAMVDQLASLQPVMTNASKVLERQLEFLRETATEAQRAGFAYEEFKGKLEELLKVGLISTDEFNARMGEFFENNLPEFEVMSTKMVTTAAVKFDQMTVYAEQAARNIQDHFAAFLFDPFDKGVKGMLSNFAKTLQRMVADLAASQLLGFLGGAMKDSGNSFIASLGAALIPGRAMGGPVTAGAPYVVGEKGPELFVPGASGNIVPGGAGMSLNYAPVINAQGADKDLRAALPGILAEDKRRLLELLHDNRSRGR